MTLGRLSLLFFGLAAACTFPDITVVVDGEGGGGNAGTGTTTAASASSTSGGPTGSTSGMGGGMTGGGGEGGAPCPDTDGDMETSILCGGTDCDDDADNAQVAHADCCTVEPCDCADYDGDVFPGQAEFFGVPYQTPDGTSFNYDCSSFEETKYTAACPQANILVCGEGIAYVNTIPFCGQSAPAQQCSGILGACSKSGMTFSLQQECH